MRNPHFDDGLLIWSDEFSGRYAPPDGGYAEQFDLQWQLHLEGRFQPSADASTDESAIADRVYEWTHQRPNGQSSYVLANGCRPLDVPIDPALIRGRRCIDIGCGLGRWTKTMLAIGAQSVLSVDVSESALAGVKTFNDETLRADVVGLTTKHPELIGRFDFANLWGVAMCTHDPLKAFLAAAQTVRPGGALYLMVYAPEGMHGSPLTNQRRRRFSQLHSIDEKLSYVERVFDRRWDDAVPCSENFKNIMRKVMRRPQGSKIGVLDALEPFYNWVIPLEVVQGWMKRAGFENVVLLNEFEPQKCAYHVLGMRAG